MTHLLSYECFHCSLRNSFFILFNPLPPLVIVAQPFQGAGPGIIFILCGFLVFATRRFMLSLTWLLVLIFFFFFHVIISLGEEGTGLYYSRVSVCSFIMFYIPSFFSSWVGCGF